MLLPLVVGLLPLLFSISAAQPLRQRLEDGFVVSPFNGQKLEPGQAFHLLYAASTPSGTVNVNLVSYHPFKDEGEPPEVNITLAAFLTSDKRGIVDAWLGIPDEEALGAVGREKTFQLMVSESDKNYFQGHLYVQAPFLKVGVTPPRHRTLYEEEDDEDEDRFDTGYVEQA